VTKEQRDEMITLAHDFCERHYLGSREYTNKALGFEAGFTAGVESEKKRAQVLIEALESIDGYKRYMLRVTVEQIDNAIAQYQKGGEGE